MDIKNTIINKLISEKARTRADFRRVVASVYKNDNTSGYHKNIDLRATYDEMLAKNEIVADKDIEKLLMTKKMRSLSGVSVITVLTKPYPCPGRCIYCPTIDNVPKSYLPDEPAVMRAIMNDYDAKRQVETRLKSLAKQGHPIDKIELIIIGGTFSYLPHDYQESFVKGCFDALNSFESDNLADAKTYNETAKSRCVGLTLETRPDYIDDKEASWFRYLGATRIELGVQTIFDDILKLNGRGETSAATEKATQILKNAGFKICYHLMPNLYGSNLAKDLEMFKTVFLDSRFKPDYIKIYPCMVMENTPLYQLWKQGKYKSYTDIELINLICDVKKNVPYWVRIMRTIRDIPATNIQSGSKMSNMRQIILAKADEESWECKCIRCREVGANIDGEEPESVELFTEGYAASKGEEYFLSYEDRDRKKLYSLLRLRFPKEGFITTITELNDCAIIREVHTYGQEAAVGELGKTQHRGYGKKLLLEAEKIAKNAGYRKIAVISGVGVRDYYRKFGYQLVGEYMIKTLS